MKIKYCKCGEELQHKENVCYECRTRNKKVGKVKQRAKDLQESC